MYTIFSRALLYLVALILTVSAGCRDTTPEKSSAPIVKTARVTLTPDSEQRTYSGVIVARREVEEAFRVGGKIEKRMVDVGDRVTKGQILATLDEKDLRLALESSQAELRAALANHEHASTNEARYRQLLERQVVSQAEYDLKHLTMEEAKGRVERADRALKLAQSQLSYATLAASIDGVATKVLAEPGQVVAQGRAVAAVAYQGEMEVLVDIPESRLEDVKSSKAEISLWADRELRIRAVLRETAPAADAATRTYAVRFSLPEADERLRMGMTATLRLTSRTDPRPMARIPATALVNQGQGPGVWVLDRSAERVVFRPVTVERYAKQDAFVQGNLAEGDMVVTAGAHKLDEKVQVRPAESGEEGGR